MSFIISLFAGYLKPIAMGIATLVGLFFVAKSSELKAENQMLNDSFEEQDKTIGIQNEVIQAANDAKPTDINGITELMRDNKL